MHVRIPGLIRVLIGAGATLAVFTGCSTTTAAPTAGSLPQPDVRGLSATSAAPEGFGARLFDAQSGPAKPFHSFISPEAKAPGGAMGFITDNQGGQVNIINAAGKVTGTLTGYYEPYGLAVDKSANLYVADAGQTRIQVYAPPYNAAPTTLHDPGQYPAGVAIDSNGNVAACNYAQIKNGFAGVSFFPQGATSPSLTLQAPAPVSQIYSCAFDASGNLFIAAETVSGAPVIGEVVGGISGTAITSLSLPAHGSHDLYETTCLQVTSNGLIAILGHFNTIYTYDPPIGGALGDLVETTPLPNNAVSGFAFTSDNRFALVNDNTGVGAVVTYPAGKEVELLSAEGAGGVGINPTEQY